MNAMNEVAAVVVTYNRKDLLLQNIECLRNQKDKSCDIFIIDNASTDGTQEAVASIADSRIHYINTGSNLGGAGGFEFGVKEAVEAGYEYIWIMDDDTLPYDDALKELLNADKELNGKWGALSSRPYWSDGSTCKANRQKKTIFSFVSDKEYDEGKHIKVTMASFVSLLVKAKIIKELGLPIGEYFIWTDDYEFTGRISKKYPIYVVPKSRVLHAMKENKKICFAREIPDRIERYNYVYRNDVHCYRQFGFTGWMYILLKAAYTTLDIWRYSDGNRWKKIKILWGGVRDGIRFHPQIKQIQ